MENLASKDKFNDFKVEIAASKNEVKEAFTELKVEMRKQMNIRLRWIIGLYIGLYMGGICLLFTLLKLTGGFAG